MSSFTLKTLKEVVARHFVRTFLAKEESDTLGSCSLGEYVSVRRRDFANDQKTFSVPRSWLVDLVQRSKILDKEGLSPSLLAEVDFSKAISTASEVVLTLWSAFRSHWDFQDPSLEKMGSDCSDLIDSVLWYVPMCGEEQQFIPYLKYQLAYLFAKGEGQDELPIRPGWMHHKDGLVLIGQLGRSFRVRALGSRLSSKEWRNTILHGIKKGLPQMGPFHLVQNLHAMKGRLTKIAETPDDLLEEVSRTAREVFPKGMIYEDWQGASPYTKISDHACWEQSRAGRGALGFLKHWDQVRTEFADFKKEVNWEISAYHLRFERLQCMAYCPSRGITLSVYMPGWEIESVYRQLQRFAVFSKVGESFSDTGYEGSLNLVKNEQGSARVKPIFEPLKVRLISAGDILSNCLFSRLQQKLWSGLQRFKAFELTGKSVTSEIVKSMSENSDKLLSDFGMKSFVSGDYSAATDNLHGDATKAAIEAISGDPITRVVLTRGLTNTWISFDTIRDEMELTDPKMAEQIPDDFLMSNGQLMGCVFSFIILCLINAAVYRASLEKFTGRRFALANLPAKINGDDILFKTNSLHYALWCEMIEKVGFEKSVGKNYVSDQFCVINSQYFDVTRDFCKVPYFNLGWCTGVTKGSGGRFEEGEDGAEKTVLGIRSKVMKTEEDWNRDPDFNLGLTERQIEKRAQKVALFKEEILRWNWDRVSETAVSTGPGPASLCLTPFKSVEDLAWSYFLYSERQDRGVSHGLNACPRTMVPWKIAKSPDSEPSKFWAERKLFRRELNRIGELEMLKKYTDKHLDLFFDRLYEDEIINPRMSVGALC